MEVQIDEGQQFPTMVGERVVQEREKTQLELAEEAGNVWEYQDQKYEKFVADGSLTVATKILKRSTKEPTGSYLNHQFRWSEISPFLTREVKSVTQLKRVGRSSEQDVDVAHQITIDAELYLATIISGEIITGEKGQFRPYEDMVRMGKTYPEVASEAVMAIEEYVHCELVEEESGDFDYIFSTPEVVKVKINFGDRENPQFVGILTFDAPSPAKRKEFEDSAQRIKSRRTGDVSIAELSENSQRKFNYGSRLLLNVEGIAVREPGNDFTPSSKALFLKLFCPIWFLAAVDVMHDSFNLVEGK